MFIRLVDLPAQGQAFHQEWKNRSLSLEPGRDVMVESASADVEALPEGGHHRLRGTATYAAVATCDRCLGDVRVAGEAPVSVVCKLREADAHVPHERPMPEGEVDDLFYAGEGVELTAVLEEAIRLEFPPRLLCKEDCRGLCPQCGANRNESPCACAQAEPEHALAGLAKLLKQDKEGA